MNYTDDLVACILFGLLQWKQVSEGESVPRSTKEGPIMCQSEILPHTAHGALHCRVKQPTCDFTAAITQLLAELWTARPRLSRRMEQIALIQINTPGGRPSNASYRIIPLLHDMSCLPWSPPEALAVPLLMRVSPWAEEGGVRTY